ncbi:MAG: endonuclease [Myxococcaceae bacterium]|nr:endonuclease [Myxococcaceae bacterium]
MVPDALQIGAMNKRDKAERIRAQLDQLYPAPPVPLDHADAFSLLVAVMLSAQTTDARVNMVTPALFARAQTPAQMAALPTEEILSFIRTCGLAPTKARNLQALSRMLVERHGGVVPRDMALLEELPGVGHKTASVVMSQAFGVPAFAVDTHIHRLAARWGLSDGSNVVKTETDLKRLYAPEHWSALHLQIIYFGREHCPALRHDPKQCPICCWAGAKRAQGAGPLARPAKPSPSGNTARKKATLTGSR